MCHKKKTNKNKNKPEITQGQVLREVTEGIKQNPFSKLMRAAMLLSLLEAWGTEIKVHMKTANIHIPFCQ